MPLGDPCAESADGLPVCFEDEHWIAVDKPSGLLVHRSAHDPKARAALQVVRDQTGRYVYPIHRLDRGTSGLLLFAFSKSAAAQLQQALTDGRKEYLALARFPGACPDLGDAWANDRPLRNDRGEPQLCHTDFVLVQRWDRCGLVRAMPRTGRYHQIRRHLNHSGRHVIGDTTHGKGKTNRFFRSRHGLRRLFLHLGVLTIEHPFRRERVVLRSALPPELVAVLTSLGAGDSG